MMWLVILPKSTKRMILPFVNQCILRLKNTSSPYVIAVSAVVYTSYKFASQTYRPLDPYTFAALLYFVILVPCAITSSAAAARVNRFALPHA